MIDRILAVYHRTRVRGDDPADFIIATLGDELDRLIEHSAQAIEAERIAAKLTEYSKTGPMPALHDELEVLKEQAIERSIGHGTLVTSGGKINVDRLVERLNGMQASINKLANR